ncbi:DoxX family protein [Candidatus Woesearchaeota archaeon]|nr:DoxX family protein [Candidatus Woesearchaeota archaeon]
MEPLRKMQTYAPTLLRIGMSLVFLWFGINQVLNPTNFLGYLPDFWFTSLWARSIIMANGAFEIVFGGMLLAGLWTRIAAALLSMHLLVITIELGYGDVAVRDFGLAMATIAIALWGEDPWCLDYRMQKNKKNA